MSSIVELFNKTLYRNSVSKILLNANKIILKSWMKTEEQQKCKTRFMAVVNSGKTFY